MLLKLIKPLDTPTIGLCEFSNCSNHKKQKKTYLLGQIGFKPDKTYCDPDTKEAEENLSLCIDCIAKLIKKVPWKTYNKHPLFINWLLVKAKMCAGQLRRGLQKDEQMTVAYDAQMEILHKIRDKKLSAEIYQEEIASKHREIEALKTSLKQLENALWASKVKPTYLSKWDMLSKKYKTQCTNRIHQLLSKDLAKSLKFVEGWEENQMQWLQSKVDNAVNKLSQLGSTADGKPKVKELRREKPVPEITYEQTTMKESQVESLSPSNDKFELAKRLVNEFLLTGNEPQQQKITRLLELLREYNPDRNKLDPIKELNRCCKLLATELNVDRSNILHFIKAHMARALSLAKQNDPNFYSKFEANYAHKCPYPNCNYFGVFLRNKCPKCHRRRPKK